MSDNGTITVVSSFRAKTGSYALLARGFEPSVIRTSPNFESISSNKIAAGPTGPAKLLRTADLGLLDANSRREWRTMGRVKSELC